MPKGKEHESGLSNIWSEIILQGIPQIVYVFNGEGRLVRWNNNAEIILEYSKQEMNNKPVLDFIAPKYREEVAEVFFGIFKSHKDATVEYKLLTKSGKQIPYMGSGSYANIDGRDYLIGQAIDISHLKNIEKDLKLQIEETNRLKRELQAENIILKDKIKSRFRFSNIIGESEQMVQLLDKVKQVVDLENPVLIIGETGTGKNLLASAIHQMSRKDTTPFIELDCSGLTSEIANAELFGRIDDSGFGIISEKPGKMELADGGILLLDNIHHLPLDIQKKLVQFMDSKGPFLCQDTQRKIQADVRIIATSLEPLDSLVAKNQFSNRLFFRLNAITLDLPPLRERKKDIPLLAHYYVSHFNQKYQKNIKKIPIKTMVMLNEYAWPGNVRELKNTIEHAIQLSNNILLKVAPLKQYNLEGEEMFIPLEEFERNYIKRVLIKTKWRVGGDKGAAKILGLHPETLRSKMKKLNISKPK